MATRPPPPLLQLPLEILFQIADYFSPQDTLDKSIMCSTGFVSWKEDYGALSRLSRTCGTLRSIAQPKLFHTLFVYPPMWLGLVTALRQHPRIRNYVKALIFPIGRSRDSGSPSARAQRKNALRPIVAYELSVLVATGALTLERAAQDPDGPRELSRIERRLCTLLLAYTAKSLELVWVDTESRPFAMFPPHYFARLIELRYSGYSFPESSLGEVDGITGSAPSLAAIKAEWIVNACLPCRLDKVETLEFLDCYLLPDSFANLAQNLPSLRSLIYDSGNPVLGDDDDSTKTSDFEVDFPELVSLLQPWQKTLRELDFQLRTIHCDRRPHSRNFHGQPYDLSGLSSFDELESLTLNGYHIREDLNDQLVTMLPRSLRTLHLGDEVEITLGHFQCLLDVIHEFPVLSSIRIRGMWYCAEERRTEILNICDGLGISVQLY